MKKFFILFAAIGMSVVSFSQVYLWTDGSCTKFPALDSITFVAPEITSLTVTPNELTFSDGDAEQRLSVTFTPSWANADIVWTSTNTMVATVNNKGVVTPVSYGETKIVATAGNYSDTCYVKVKPYLETLVFNNAVIWSYDTLAIDGIVSI